MISCDKDNDDLKDCKTDPNCEYFRCKVNGEEWRPDCESSLFGCTHTDVQYYKESGNLNISSKDEIAGTYLVIIVLEIKKSGVPYNIYSGPNIKSKFGDNNNEEDCIIFEIDTTSISEMYISEIDTINYIISGTFHFSAKNKCEDIIEITNGEFRQKYRF